MRTSDECCGWLGWAEMAGIGADGKRLNQTPTGTTILPPVTTRSHELSFITTALRRVLRDSARESRPQ